LDRSPARTAPDLRVTPLQSARVPFFFAGASTLPLLPFHPRAKERGESDRASFLRRPLVDCFFASTYNPSPPLVDGHSSFQPLWLCRAEGNRSSQSSSSARFVSIDFFSPVFPGGTPLLFFHALRLKEVPVQPSLAPLLSRSWIFWFRDPPVRPYHLRFVICSFLSPLVRLFSFCAIVSIFGVYRP